MTTAMRKTALARATSSAPIARAIAPLTAPPIAPVESIWVNIKIGKVSATLANASRPKPPTYQASVTIRSD